MSVLKWKNVDLDRRIIKVVETRVEEFRRSLHRLRLKGYGAVALPGYPLYISSDQRVYFCEGEQVIFLYPKHDA